MYSVENICSKYASWKELMTKNRFINPVPDTYICKFLENLLQLQIQLKMKSLFITVYPLLSFIDRAHELDKKTSLKKRHIRQFVSVWNDCVRYLEIYMIKVVEKDSSNLLHLHSLSRVVIKCNLSED